MDVGRDAISMLAAWAAAGLASSDLTLTEEFIIAQARGVRVPDGSGLARGSLVRQRSTFRMDSDLRVNETGASVAIGGIEGCEGRER